MTLAMGHDSGSHHDPSNHAPVIDHLRRERQAIYATGKTVKSNGQLVDVWPIGMTADRGAFLIELVTAAKARRCIETGMAYGMSTSYLLEACLSVHDPAADIRDPLVTSIDPFETAAWGRAGVLQIERAGAACHHELIEERSEYALPRLVAAGARFDLALIDGDHRFEHAFLDVFYLRRLVGPEGLIVVDDAWMPSVQKACAFFAAADLCVIEENAAASAASKFLILRTTARGDARAWDHFQDF